VHRAGVHSTARHRPTGCGTRSRKGRLPGEQEVAGSSPAIPTTVRTTYRLPHIGRRTHRIKTPRRRCRWFTLGSATSAVGSSRPRWRTRSAAHRSATGRRTADCVLSSRTPSGARANGRHAARSTSLPSAEAGAAAGSALAPSTMVGHVTALQRVSTRDSGLAHLSLTRDHPIGQVGRAPERSGGGAVTCGNVVV